MARSRNNNNAVIAMVALLLFVLLLAGGFVLFGGQGSDRPHTTTGQLDANENPSNTPPPLELEPEPEPNPQPEPQPEAEPTKPERAPVALGPMTRFRALVKEADHVLALRDTPGMDPALVWEAVSTLEQLESRFAPYAKLLYAGNAEGADRIHFESDASRSFERPDVASSAYLIEATPRVAVWLREGAELPAAESVAPPDVSIPLTRRLQEDLSADILAGWLNAIESEYGEADFGEAGVPLDFVVFPELASYLRFSEKRLLLDVPKWSAGFYSTKWDVICMPLLPNTSLAEVARHEMFHAVQAHKAPQSLLVPWFAEGSAEWLDKAAPEGALRTHPEFQAAAFGYLRTLVAQGFKLDLKAFLAQDLPTFYQDPELNYLVAYCFVDFCRANEDLRAIYFEFWKLMCEGVGAENAFARTFGGLDMAELQRRFLARLQSFPRATQAPRFSHDAPAEHFASVPRELGGVPAATAPEGEVNQGWFKVLGDLQEKGFDTGRSAYFKGDYDLLIVAIDSSESMSQRITTEGFDFQGLSHWLFSLRYAGTLTLKRKSEGGESSEEVPPSVLMALVDAVLTDRMPQFTDTTGITVSDEVSKDIKANYKAFELSPDKLKTLSKREISRHTAESVAWYWGTRQDQADVVLVDFNLEVQVEKEKNSFKAKGYNSSSSPLQRLFAKTAPHAAPEGSHGADTDWWAAMQAVIQAAADASAGRVACLFFTDGPNSLGFYGHLEQGRDDTQYLLDQEKLATELKIQWDNAGLGYESQPSILQLIALPGAESQGLDLIPQKVTQAKLDEWQTHFVK